MKARPKRPSQGLFHVTDRKFVDDILEHGFLPGWGDWGFGIYFFDNIVSARAYAAGNGWDHSLEDPVILAMKTSEAVQKAPDPGWSDPEKYLSIWYVPRKEEQADTYWKRGKIQVV